MTALNIEKVLEKIKELPTLPDVVFRVNEVVNNPKTSAVDLEEVISRDQAIAAKVLKMVNSAFYGLPGRVDTLARAIPLLGFSTVRNIVMSISIFDIGPIENFDMKQFWRHSFGTSVVARAIAVAEGLPDADSHSLAGLLHDMGKVLLFQHYSKEYEKVAALMERKRMTFIRAERELYSIDHAEVGGALASRWGFPPNTTASIAHHHNPEPAGDLIDFVSVTATANVLSQIGIQNGIFAINGSYKSLSEACLSFHALSESTFNAVSAELTKQMQFFDNFIDRMELFRRPSPLIDIETQRVKNKASIWTLPER